MAHFYAWAKGRANTSVGRIGDLKTGVSASVASYDMGITTYAAHVSAHNADVFQAQFDGGSGGNGRAGRVDYCREGDQYVVVPDVEFMLKISDMAWESLLANPQLIAKLKALVFVHMDKLP
jgi:hypothetical protein